MLDKFPGILGYGGIIAIHADWPMYPSGIGWQIALKTLGNFPEGTDFYEIDDIDRCKLLINIDPKTLSDPTDGKHYHIAIWHSDLIELKERCLITGVIKKSDYEFRIYEFDNFKKKLGENLHEDEDGNIILYFKDDKGELHESKYSKPKNEDEEDEDDFVFRGCVVIPDTIKLSLKGIEELAKLSKEIRFSDELKDLTEPLSKFNRFDTAIREASLFVESNIKNFHNKPNLFGQNLVDYHIEDVIKNNNNFNSAAIKCYRGELRTIFKFIRNDFAHNFKVLTEEQCIVILNRINELLIEFNEVINVYYNEKNT